MQTLFIRASGVQHLALPACSNSCQDDTWQSSPHRVPRSITLHRSTNSRSPAVMEEDGQQQLDLEGMIAAYSGHNRINRLLFIADKRQNQPIELEALRLAHDEVKQTENLQAYQAVIDRIAGRLGPAYNLDRSWVASTERSLQAKQDRLEQELAGYKANLIKESIRMGHNDLGDHFYSRGDMQNAFKCYIRARDYCSTGRHILTMCLNVVRVSIEMGNQMHVGNYVAKAENTPDAQSDPIAAAKLAAANGLSMMAAKRYKQAARKLLEVTSDLGSHFNDVLAMQDVALYASLCALATLDRDEVQRRLIKNVAFKELLDTVPEVREIVHDFHACRYARALSTLTRLAPTVLGLDPHLEPHAQHLLHQIRQRALVQYTSPFTSVRLSTMATAFNTTAGDLGKELSSLILEGAIPARIDAHAGVLYARQTNVRSTTFTKTLVISQQYVRETKAAMLRVDLLKNDFIQKPPLRAGGRGAGGSVLAGLEGFEDLPRRGFFGDRDRSGPSGRPGGRTSAMMANMMNMMGTVRDRITGTATEQVDDDEDGDSMMKIADTTR